MMFSFDEFDDMLVVIVVVVDGISSEDRGDFLLVASLSSFELFLLFIDRSSSSRCTNRKRRSHLFRAIDVRRRILRCSLLYSFCSTINRDGEKGEKQPRVDLLLLNDSSVLFFSLHPTTTSSHQGVSLMSSLSSRSFNTPEKQIKMKTNMNIPYEKMPITEGTPNDFALRIDLI